MLDLAIILFVIILIAGLIGMVFADTDCMLGLTSNNLIDNNVNKKLSSLVSTQNKLK